MPPPTIKALSVTFILWEVRGSRYCARCTAPCIRAMALLVAFSLSSWTQLQCSLMFTMSKRYGLSPADLAACLKVSKCILGEQEATITRLSLFFSMAFLIISWPGLLQTYSKVSATPTFSRDLTASLTRATSTVSLMFPPQ